MSNIDPKNYLALYKVCRDYIAQSTDLRNSDITTSDHAKSSPYEILRCENHHKFCPKIIGKNSAMTEQSLVSDTPVPTKSTRVMIICF